MTQNYCETSDYYINKNTCITYYCVGQNNGSTFVETCKAHVRGKGIISMGYYNSKTNNTFPYISTYIYQELRA